MPSDNQLPPMTPEHIEPEAAYAEQIYHEVINMPLDQFRAKLKQGKRSKAAHLVPGYRDEPKPQK